MTRLTLTISVNDAYLWDARTRGNVFIDIIVDDTMEDTLFGKSGYDTTESFEVFHNKLSSLSYRPKDGTKMLFAIPDGPKYNLICGEDVRITKVDSNADKPKYVVEIVSAYKHKLENKNI